MKPMLYISDLDGTLLNKHAELSLYTKKGLTDILQANVNFTVASARSVKSIQQMFAGIELYLPVIEFNGAFISDVSSGEHIKINALNNKIYNDLINRYSRQKCNFFISSFNGSDDKLYYQSTVNPGQEWYISDRIKNEDPRLEKICDITSIIDEDIVCMTIIDSYENLIDEFSYLQTFSNIEVHLQENHYSPGWYWLTVHSAEATKDKAIASLKEIANLNNTSATVFGDNTNDIKMMQAADVAVAVENAKPEVKQIAHKIIGKNTDDSVIKYIVEMERTNGSNR